MGKLSEAEGSECLKGRHRNNIHILLYAIYYLPTERFGGEIYGRIRIVDYTNFNLNFAILQAKDEAPLAVLQAAFAAALLALLAPLLLALADAIIPCVR